MALEIDRVAREPFLPPLSKPVEPPAPAPTPLDPVLLGSADTVDIAGLTEAMAPLVELCLSEQAQTPFRVGLIGPLGAGKSFALNRLRRTLADLGSRNPGAGASRPPEFVVATLDASGLSVDPALGFDPASALASAVFTALESGRDGANYAALADDAAHGAGDPRRAAAAASERQDELARRLDGERAARDELEAKRARLVEALIYETPGSRVDAMIRSNRSTIEARLRRFGFGAGDVAQNFRDLVRDLSGSGAGSHVSLFLRSLWAFRGQITLLLVAVVALLAALGVDRLREASAAGVFAGMGAAVEGVAQSLVDHPEWTRRTISALVAVAVLALVTDLWRAAGFSALLFRAQRLLNIDVYERRAELDASAARLDKRIAGLSAEADAAAKRAEALVQRAGGGAQVSRAPGPAFLTALRTPAKASREFFSELGRLMREPATREMPKPKRVIVTIDNLEALPPAEALRLIDIARAILGPGVAALIACDPERLSPGDSRLVARDRFDLVFNLSACGERDSAKLAARMIAEGGRPGGGAPKPSPEKLLIEPISAQEAAWLAAMAPLTDGTPGAVKRLHNAYRIARLAKAPRPLVALMIAALQGSRAEYSHAIGEALAAADDRFEEPAQPFALQDAFQAARGAHGAPFEKAEAQAAWEAARLWTPSQP
jgi:hypothetical protein